MEPRVALLENSIRCIIAIPQRLVNNMCFTTTGLGGVFLQYASNSSGGVKTLNSKVRVTIHFPSTDDYGRYIGDVCGMEFTTAKGIKGLRSINKPKDYRLVVEKVNNWLEENENYLYSVIEDR